MSVISSRPKVSNTSEPIKDEACDSDKASGVATPTSTEQDDEYVSVKEDSCIEVN